MNKKITVITATKGRDSLHQAIESVRKQVVPCHHIVVFDGIEPTIKGDENLTVLRTPTRTGFAIYYGHRIYAGMSFLVNTPFVSYLDDDNTFTDDWSEVMLEAMYMNRIMPWAVTCRRSLYHKGEFMGVDNRESIGRNEYGYALYDMNTYLIQTQITHHMALHISHRSTADRLMAEFFLKYNAVLHIRNSLVNYTVNENKYNDLKEVVK